MTTRTIQSKQFFSDEFTQIAVIVNIITFIMGDLFCNKYEYKKIKHSPKTNTFSFDMKMHCVYDVDGVFGEFE